MLSPQQWKERGGFLVCDEKIPPLSHTKAPTRNRAGEASPEECFDLSPGNKPVAAAAMMWRTPPSSSLDAGLSNGLVEHPNHHSNNYWLLSHLGTEKALHRASNS